MAHAAVHAAKARRAPKDGAVIAALVIVAAWAVLTVIITVVLSRVLGKPTPTPEQEDASAAVSTEAGR